MREIKFRAFNKETQKMHTGFGWDNCDYDGWVDFEDGSQLQRRILRECEEMQFINRLDKNGKEIYEDDIINEPRGVVKWNSSYPEFYIYGTDGKGIDYDFRREVEVIGNIHETPDLLTKS